MKILYISSLISDNLFESFVAKSETKGYVGQKYHGLFVRGLTENLGAGSVTALSQPPISKTFIKIKDYEDGVKYRYIPIINIIFVKQVVFFIYSLFYTLYWSIKNHKEEKVIICSIMRIYQYLPAKIASFFFPCIKVTIACDVPWMTTIQVAGAKKKLSHKENLSIWLSKKLCSSFDLYILLTQKMTDVLNPKKRPYIVVEGFSDIKMKDIPNEYGNKNAKDVILYAGGLNAVYGVLDLVKAVKNINNSNIELWLYGNGDVAEQLKNEVDSRIKYFGARSNKEVVKAELEATLLINPRPTTGEYTHYSFPSKTMEYMASGTYTLTTRLAGIPDEYYDYCFPIEDFSTEGIRLSIERALLLGRQELYRRGLEGKEFVLDKKNNIVQASKVIEFINNYK